MSSSFIDNELTPIEPHKTSIKDNIEPFVDEELPGTLESSGGSSELQAPHLQASTVTFTGVPLSPSSDSIPPVEQTSKLPDSVHNPKSVDITCMYFQKNPHHFFPQKSLLCLFVCNWGDLTIKPYFTHGSSWLYPNRIS